jgi:hypothetical protein
VPFQDCESIMMICVFAPTQSFRFYRQPLVDGYWTSRTFVLRCDTVPYILSSMSPHCYLFGHRMRQCNAAVGCVTHIFLRASIWFWTLSWKFLFLPTLSPLYANLSPSSYSLRTREAVISDHVSKEATKRPSRVRYHLYDDYNNTRVHYLG